MINNLPKDFFDRYTVKSDVLDLHLKGLTLGQIAFNLDIPKKEVKKILKRSDVKGAIEIIKDLLDE